MTSDDRIRDAPESVNPMDALRGAAKGLLAEGWARDDVTTLFDRHRVRCYEDGREDRADVVDFLVGWCAPHMRP